MSDKDDKDVGQGKQEFRRKIIKTVILVILIIALSALLIYWYFLRQ
ncbi:MAG TPA: hypothetical protein P5064_02370 [Clostridia bacterium]|jgi:flagellar basal body-associated protein FliL|nr:hypothetical protein [Clostridiaceae bacterium]HOF26868.1 hypothetical protein [Clostridia bacterium]HOM34950.1 hypothetical protein [Clostridia bacterium]HOR90121.1 hypothetical protein [Clostridia bacterium]HOT70383.1 hypothetical protein [Clostridia bacterium]